LCDAESKVRIVESNRAGRDPLGTLKTTSRVAEVNRSGWENVVVIRIVLWENLAQCANVVDCLHSSRPA
jgi:hypothetical protein